MTPPTLSCFVFSSASAIDPWRIRCNAETCFFLSVGGRNCHIETSAGLQREASRWVEAQAGHDDVKWAETEPKQELERCSVKHSVSKLFLLLGSHLHCHVFPQQQVSWFPMLLLFHILSVLLFTMLCFCWCFSAVSAPVLSLACYLTVLVLD